MYCAWKFRLNSPCLYPPLLPLSFDVSFTDEGIRTGGPPFLRCGRSSVRPGCWTAVSSDPTTVLVLVKHWETCCPEPAVSTFSTLKKYLFRVLSEMLCIHSYSHKMRCPISWAYSSRSTRGHLALALLLLSVLENEIHNIMHSGIVGRCTTLNSEHSASNVRMQSATGGISTSSW